MVRVKAKLGEKFIQEPKTSIGWSWEILIVCDTNYASRDSASRGLRNFKKKYNLKLEDTQNSIFILNGDRDG